MLTLSGRDRHCRTCRVRRRTRRWPAGRSWCVSVGRGAGAGGAARHAAAASSALDQPAQGLTSHKQHCTALKHGTTTPGTVRTRAADRVFVSPHENRARDAATANAVRLTVREPGIHFLVADGTHAQKGRAVAPPGLQQCASRLAHLDRCSRNKTLIHTRIAGWMLL